MHQATPKSGDGVALMSVYRACLGDQWFSRTNWGQEPLLDRWYGVAAKLGFVVSLELSNNNLKGESTRK